MVNNNVLQTAEGNQIAKITESSSERVMALKKIKPPLDKSTNVRGMGLGKDQGQRILATIPQGSPLYII